MGSTGEMPQTPRQEVPPRRSRSLPEGQQSRHEGLQKKISFMEGPLARKKGRQKSLEKMPSPLQAQKEQEMPQEMPPQSRPRLLGCPPQRHESIRQKARSP